MYFYLFAENLVLFCFFFYQFIFLLPLGNILDIMVVDSGIDERLQTNVGQPDFCNSNIRMEIAQAFWNICTRIALVCPSENDLLRIWGHHRGEGEN